MVNQLRPTPQAQDRLQGQLADLHLAKAKPDHDHEALTFVTGTMSVGVGAKVGAPKRNKKASKKKKASWRKNTDLDDVEEFLEDQRAEARLGGAFSQRKDEELFAVDGKGQDQEENADAGEGPDRLRKRRQAQAEPLKCFSHLEIKGGAKDPKGRNSNIGKKRQQLKQKSLEIRSATKGGGLKAKDRLAKKHRQQEQVRREVRRKESSTRRRTNFDFDLWGGDSLEDRQNREEADKKEDDDWVEDNTRRHNLKGTGKLTRSIPADLHKKPSDLSAVSAPHSGASYNPSYADHQDLLRKAWVAEINKDAAQHKIDYHTTRMFPSANEAPTEQTWLKEMTEGIVQEEDDEESQGQVEEKEDTSEEEEEDVARRDGGNKLKTRKQRRQHKERMAAERKVKRAKRTKEVEQDVFRLKSLKREIAGEERRVSERSAKRAAEKLRRERTQPAALSRHKFEEADLEIKLSEELTGNLRSLKPEGNLLEDRYKSMQRRNMVETRLKTKIVKKKHKRKKLEKRSYKMPWEKQNA